MKTKLNRKSLFGHSGQVIAWLIVAFCALSFPFARRAHAQSGGPGADAGVVTSIDDAKLDLREGSRTITYVTTEQTQWLNKRGQRIDPGDVVGKMVEVRFRWITGGSEALSVQLTSGGGSSRPAHIEDAGDPSSLRHERGDQVLRGTIGGGEAVFRLRLEDGNVTGTYSPGSKSYRIEGTYTPGHMSLDEYTGERLTAHIKLTLDDLETTWTGTMHNIYPDKNHYPVSLSKSQ
jgi:hypothetical protein